MNEIFDLAVIGGGPAGYVCSIKAAQLGLSVACIDSRENLGGTCLNEGCIPSKALLNSSYYYDVIKSAKMKNMGIEVGEVALDLAAMMNNKNSIIMNLANGIDWLFKKNGVTRFCGHARIVVYDGEIKKLSVSSSENQTLLARNVVIAVGSEVMSIPGINIDRKVVITSTEALSLNEVPKDMIVVGAGVIGLEISSIWSRLGSKVTVIESCDRISPFLDVEVSTYMKKCLEKQCIKFLTNTKVNNISVNGDVAHLICSDINSGSEINIVSDKVLISVGRKPYSKDIGAPIATSDRGFILVDDNFETNIKSIYAIGDVTVGPMLAHKAEEDGSIVAEIIAGKKNHHKGFIPSVIYTHPEVAYVGKTEQELQKEGIEYRVGKFPFTANSRAIVNNDSEGFVKILVNKFDTILGIHIISSHASLLIGEALVALEYGASAEDIARMIHSHPDLGEAIKESAMIASLGKAINYS